MNFITFLSILTMVIAIGFAAFALIKNIRSAANIFFSLALLGLAGVVSGDMLVFQTEILSFEWRKITMFSEVVFPFGWLLFSFTFSLHEKKLIFYVYLLLSTMLIVGMGGFLWFTPIDFFLYWDNHIIYLREPGFFFYMGICTINLIALVRLESIFFSTKRGPGWSMKYAVVGIGGLLGMFVFYYSHSILYKRLEMHLLPARNGVSLVTTIILIAAFAKYKFLELNFSITQRAFYSSFVLFVAGTYFIFLGVLGEGMKYVNENISRNLIIFLAFAGTLTMSILLLSENFRRRTKRYLSNHFYAAKYDYKEEWLKFTKRLSLVSTSTEVQRAALESMIDTFGVNGAFFWQYDAVKKKYKCTCSVEREPIVDVIPCDSPLIGCLKTGKIYNANEANGYNDECYLPFFAVRCISIVIPILSMDTLSGMIMFGESIGDYNYDYEDYELMTTLTRQVAYAVTSMELSEKLAESREMEAVGRLASFVIHDIKNMITSLSMLIENAKHLMNNPEFQKDMILTVASSVERSKTVISKLSHFGEKQDRVSEIFPVKAVVEEVLSKLSVPSYIKLTYTQRGFLTIEGEREEIKKVILNLIFNAIEAIETEGVIDIDVFKEDGYACFKIKDTGQGMSSDFIDKKLFKPFRTEKKGGTGIGLYHSKSIVESHGGYIEVESHKGSGTTFWAYLPLATKILKAEANQILHDN